MEAPRKILEKMRACRNCDFHADNYVCVNGNSYNCGDFTGNDSYCRHWQRKKEEKREPETRG